MQVHFVSNYTHPGATRSSETAYRKGWTGTVSKDVGEAAVAAGAAQEISGDDAATPRAAIASPRRGKPIESEPPSESTATLQEPPVSE